MNRILRLAVLALPLMILGGCVVAPAAPPPPGSAYAPGYAVYPPPVSIGLGFGGCWHCGWGWHRWR